MFFFIKRRNIKDLLYSTVTFVIGILIIVYLFYGLSDPYKTTFQSKLDRFNQLQAFEETMPMEASSIRRVIVVANNKHPNNNTFEYLKSLQLEKTDIVVRFGDFPDMHWFQGRTDIFLNICNADCYKDTENAIPIDAIERFHPYIYVMSPADGGYRKNIISCKLDHSQIQEDYGNCYKTYGVRCPTIITCAICHIKQMFNKASLILLGFSFTQNEQLFWFNMQQHYQVQHSQIRTILCPFEPPKGLNENSGWYYNLSQSFEGDHVAQDPGLGGSLIKYLNRKKIVDIGCGLGQLGYFIKSNKANISWTGLDGGNNVADLFGMKIGIRHQVDYVVPAVCWADASSPIDLQYTYDWVVSFEVGEHIPKQYESVFIDNLVKLSKEGVIVSWAIIGQSGRQHINCQNNKYIITEMESRGMKYDEKQSKLFRASVTVNKYFTNTVMVFHKIPK